MSTENGKYEFIYVSFCVAIIFIYYAMYIFPTYMKHSKMAQLDFKLAESITLVFAVINMVITSVSMVLALAGVLYWFFIIVLPELQRKTSPPYESDGLHIFFTYFLFGCVLLFLLFSMVALTFAACLLHGVFKKRADYIKAYFLYGVIVVFLSLVAAIAYSNLTEDKDPVTVIIALFLLTTYSLILMAIRMTYKHLESKAGLQYGNQLLVVATTAPVHKI